MANVERRFCKELKGALEDEDTAISTYKNLSSKAKKMDRNEVRGELLDIAADEIEHQVQLEQIDTVVCE